MSLRGIAMIWTHSINPVFFELWGFSFRYYGLVYVLGFLFTLFFLLRAKKKGRLSLSSEALWDLGIFVFLGILLGGRLGYILLYGFSFYLQNPGEILAFWHGGMSFHGALFGGLIAGGIFCHVKKVSFYQIADIIVIPIAFVLIFGRLANFLNGELYGRITDGSWGVLFAGESQLRHPSQLYEASKNVLIFGILWLLYQKNVFTKGFLFWTFIFLYGLFRFIIEFWREPEIVLGVFSMGQWLSLLMIVLGVGYLYRICIYEKANEKKISC